MAGGRAFGYRWGIRLNASGSSKTSPTAFNIWVLSLPSAVPLCLAVHASPVFFAIRRGRVPPLLQLHSSPYWFALRPTSRSPLLAREDWEPRDLFSAMSYAGGSRSCSSWGPPCSRHGCTLHLSAPPSPSKLFVIAVWASLPVQSPSPRICPSRQCDSGFVALVMLACQFASPNLSGRTFAASVSASEPFKSRYFVLSRFICCDGPRHLSAACLLCASVTVYSQRRSFSALPWHGTPWPRFHVPSLTEPRFPCSSPPLAALLSTLIAAFLGSVAGLRAAGSNDCCSQQPTSLPRFALALSSARVRLVAPGCSPLVSVVIAFLMMGWLGLAASVASSAPAGARPGFRFPSAGRAPPAASLPAVLASCIAKSPPAFYAQFFISIPLFILTSEP